MKEMQTIDPLLAAITSLREWARTEGPVRPAPSPRPLVGSFITAVRRFVWRLAGPSLWQELERERVLQERVVAFLHRLEQFVAPTFHIREDTLDEGIFRTVHDANEYRLPDHLEPEDIVLDIGMHIGAFCYAVVERGSHHVYGFEAERGNYECAVRNLRPFSDRVHLFHQAVFRSDRAGDKLFHCGYPATKDGTSNTGGGNLLWVTSGEEMNVVAFDDVLRRVSDDGRRRIKLLKIDCEGSEYPILLTSQLRHLIDHIHGEYHDLASKEIPPNFRVPGVDLFTGQELARHLSDDGFQVELAPVQGSTIGLFFARNRQAPELN